MRDNLLRMPEALLFLAGAGCLAVALGTVAERIWFQRRYASVDYSPASAGERSTRGGPLGRIEIPRVGVSAVILSGVDDRTLRRGVGHVPGTALPGGPAGRIVLAAHRDTFFRNLRLVRPGDTVRLAVPGLTVEYSIERTEVVKPWQTEVLRPEGEEVLTLLTCYPFTYLGPAPERFVVHARRTGQERVPARERIQDRGAVAVRGTGSQDRGRQGAVEPPGVRGREARSLTLQGRSPGLPRRFFRTFPPPVLTSWGQGGAWRESWFSVRATPPAARWPRASCNRWIHASKSIRPELSLLRG